jgi:hypothetical protein
MNLNPATISTVIIAFLALIAAIGGGMRWLYRRGRDEQTLSGSIEKQAEATDRNTAATADLAGQVGGLRKTLEDHGNRLIEHHYRIKALEDGGIKVSIEKTGP